MKMVEEFLKKKGINNLEEELMKEMIQSSNHKFSNE
jgi:hypothetical protein